MTNMDERNDAASGQSRREDARGEPDRRDNVVDRRAGLDRRDVSHRDKMEPLRSNLDRRRGPGRRRTDFMKAAEEGEMTQEQFMFVMAIAAFKQSNNMTFPTWTDVLEVIRKLGYRKTMPSSLNLGSRVEDWIERSDAPDGVSKITPPEEEEELDA